MVINKFSSHLFYVCFIVSVRLTTSLIKRPLFTSILRVKAVLKNSPAVATGDRENYNGDQAQAVSVSPVQTSKSDSDLVRDNEEKFRFCPQEKDMDKMLDGLPPFTFNSIVKYIRNSGKNIQHSPDYMVMKPLERGVNFLLKGISIMF